VTAVAQSLRCGTLTALLPLLLLLLLPLLLLLLLPTGGVLYRQGCVGQGLQGAYQPGR
jgi:hypothetical protein